MRASTIDESISVAFLVAVDFSDRMTYDLAIRAPGCQKWLAAISMSTFGDIRTRTPDADRVPLQWGAITELATAFEDPIRRGS